MAGTLGTSSTEHHDIDMHMRACVSTATRLLLASATTTTPASNRPRVVTHGRGHEHIDSRQRDEMRWSPAPSRWNTVASRRELR